MAVSPPHLEGAEQDLQQHCHAGHKAVYVDDVGENVGRGNDIESAVRVEDLSVDRDRVAEVEWSGGGFVW